MASNDMNRYFATHHLNMSRFASVTADANSLSDSKLQGNAPPFVFPAAGSAQPGTSRSAFASFGGMFGGMAEHGGSSGPGMDGMAVGSGAGVTGGMGLNHRASPAFAQLLVGVQEFTHDALEEPMMGIQVLRIHTTFGKLPFKYLNDLLEHRQDYSVREVQLCIQSTLRPCLQDIDEDVGLALRLVALGRNFFDAGLDLKWHFLRPTVQVGVGLLRYPFQNYVEKDMLRAIQALKEHGYELTEILGDESTLRQAKTSTVSAHKRNLSHSSAMEIDELI